MKITIEGSASKLKRLAKELRLRAKRDKLTMTLHGKVDEAKENKPEPITYPHNAKDTVKLVMATTSIEELNAFETDERETVKKAVEQQKVNFIEINTD